MKIRKRDGRIVAFDDSKITDAIFAAAQAVGGGDREMAVEITLCVLKCLKAENKVASADKQDYTHLLRESLCARLAEATAEWIQQQVAEGTHVIRPAFGYPACPDHSLKHIAFELLDAPQQIGVALTETYSIIPSTSLCGMLISHPHARYFSVGME